MLTTHAPIRIPPVSSTSDAVSVPCATQMCYSALTFARLFDPLAKDNPSIVNERQPQEISSLDTTNNI